MKQNEWQEKSLEEVTKIIMGQSPDSKTYNFEDNGTPFLQGCADFKSLYPDTNTFCSNPVKMAPEQSILFSVRAPVGEINLSDKEYCIGRGLASIVPDKVDTYFLFYALKLNRNKFSNLGQGSTFEAIDSKTLKEFKLKIPQVSEQQKIAEILTTVDNTIEKTEQIIEKYKKVKEGMMQDLFTRGIDENGNLRPSYEQAPHLYKETELGMIPKEWEVKKLKDNASINYGISDTLKYDLKTGIKLISLPNVNIDGSFNFEKEYYIEPRNVSKHHILQQGDLLFNWRNGSKEHLGKTALFNLKGEYTHVGFLLKIRPDKEKCLSKYLWYYINFIREQGFFYRAKSQVNNTFNLTELKELSLKIPPLEEQTLIQRAINKIDKNIEFEKEFLEKLKLLKQGLMQDLLTGKVRVKV